MNKSDIAYRKGYEAYKSGKPMSENFYSWNSRVAGLAGWWDKGWLDAEREFSALIAKHRTNKEHR